MPPPPQYWLGLTVSSPYNRPDRLIKLPRALDERKGPIS